MCVFVFRVYDHQVVLRPAQHDACHHLHNCEGFSETGHTQHHTGRGWHQFTVDHNQVPAASIDTFIQSPGLEQFLRGERNVNGCIDCQKCAFQ